MDRKFIDFSRYVYDTGFRFWSTITDWSDSALKHLSDSDSNQPNLWSWLKSDDGKLVRYVFYFATIAVALNIGLMIYYSDNEKALSVVKSIFYIEHLLILAVGLYISVFKSATFDLDIDKIVSPIDNNFDPEEKLNDDDNEQDYIAQQEIAKSSLVAALNRANNATNVLFLYWPFLWLVWTLLYFALFINAISDPDKVAIPILHFLNNLSAVVFLSLYHELTFSTQNDPRHGPKASKPVTRQVWMVFFVGCLFLGAAELVLIEILPPDSKQNIKLFGTISGLLVAVATALLVTRFASKTLDVPPLVLVVLCLYAAIQPVFSLIPNPEGFAEVALATISISIALYSKVLLLAVFHWLRDSHRLMYYLVRGVELNNDERYLRGRFVNLVEPAIKSD